MEIIPLEVSHIHGVKVLLAGYLNSASSAADESDPPSEQLEQCEQILHRFIRDSSAKCYLAKHGEEYVGFIILSWSFSISKGYPVLRVEALYSSSKHRRKGAGRKLMEHAIDLAVANKANRLQLETDEKNAPARALYEELGFEFMQGKMVYMSFL